MNFIINNCEQKVQEQFYDLGAGEQLPEKYEKYKNSLSEFGKGLVKLKDEKRNQYIDYQACGS